MHPVHDLDRGSWAVHNPSKCPCRGQGWFLSDWDTWHACPLHGKGVPHPEEDESFDWPAHHLTSYRAAYRDFLAESGMNPQDFRAACEKHLGEDPRPSDWVDAADRVAEDIMVERLEARAQAQGYSCRLEAALDAEAHIEAEARYLGVDSDQYATEGSPERAEADSWYRS